MSEANDIFLKSSEFEWVNTYMPINPYSAGG